MLNSLITASSGDAGDPPAAGSSLTTSGCVNPSTHWKYCVTSWTRLYAGALAPRADRLLVEHPVAEAHDAHSPRLQHPEDLREHLTKINRDKCKLSQLDANAMPIERISLFLAAADCSS